LPVDVAFFLGGALKFHNFGNCDAFGIVEGATVVVPLCRALSIIVSLGVMLDEFSSVYLLIWCAHVGIINAHVSKSQVKRSQLLSLVSTHAFQLAMLRETEECIHPDCHQWPQLLHCRQEGRCFLPTTAVSYQL
jgi:hypothetical protein